MLKTLAAEIARHPYSAHAERGFIQTEVRGKSIAGRFIQRVIGEQIFRDAFGGAVKMPFVTFETTAFRLSSVAPQIELLDAPRGAKRMFQFLDELGSISLAVDVIEVDPVAWIEALVPTFGTATVRELGCRDLAISPSLAADMTFTGSGDVLASSQKFLGPKLKSVKFARAEFANGNRSFEIQFNTSASIKAITDLPSGALNSIRDVLRTLL
ncbi:MAG TPA: hypothetical protein VHD85_04820 [Terracidiphilus sp.]|nr:hypothetical protein [Terracidiphilus sp.]